MPVQLTRDEQMPARRRPADPEAEARLLQEAMRRGTGSAVVVLVIAVAPLVVGMRALRPALVAADKLLRSGGDYWSEMWMPVVLFAFFGFAFGGGLAWRVCSAASLGGKSAWMVVGAAITVLTLVGVITAALVFVGPVPIMCWTSLGGMAGAAIAGTYLAFLWID